MENDAVNHPKHYTTHPSGIECIQITEHMGFNLGNAVKYIWRADLKANAIEDLKKAAWYLAREIAKRETQPGQQSINISIDGRLTGEDMRAIADAALPTCLHPFCAKRTHNGKRGYCAEHSTPVAERCYACGIEFKPLDIVQRYPNQPAVHTKCPNPLCAKCGKTIVDHEAYTRDANGANPAHISCTDR